MILTNHARKLLLRNLGFFAGLVSCSTVSAYAANVTSTISMSYDGLCAAIAGGSKKAGGVLEQWTCYGSSYETFTFVPVTGGKYKIKSANSLLCLDSGKESGNQVVQNTCSSTKTSQAWSLVDNSNGSYRIETGDGKYCMDDEGISSALGNPIITYSCNGGANQAFTLAGFGGGSPSPTPTPSPTPSPTPTPTPSPSPSPTSSSGSALIGVVPLAQPTNPAADAAFSSWLGVPVPVVLTYGDPSSWSNLDGDVAWEMPSYQGTNLQVVESIPLAMSTTSLAQVASGSNDSDFLSVAQSIAKVKPNAIIRLGWEFNGNWYAWSIVGGHAQDYINAFQHVVGIFRSVSPSFKFDWCTNWSFTYAAPDQAYPGDAYVDYIGMDTYDQSGNAANDFTSSVINTSYGLAWQASFAAQHGKQMSYPEWGAGQYGDDPAFIQGMYNWITAHDVSYHDYWNTDSDYAGCLTCGDHPQEAAMYQQHFGQ